jgi:3-oxoacyl-[acyl-carrier-protein] synthase-3
VDEPKMSCPIHVAGIGHYLPARVVDNEEVERRCDLPAGWIAEKTGVLQRRWVTDETNSSMGARAALEALDDAGLPLDEVGLVINASGTQEQAIPDGGPLLLRELGRELGAGAAAGIASLTVHATCLSFVVALDLAASLLATGRYRTILIVTSEIGSVGINFEQPESASLIGDGAAAVVVRPPAEDEPGRLRAARFETYSDGVELACIRGGGSRRHPCRPETRPEDNYFDMDGPRIFRFALKHLRGFLERLRPGLSRGLGSVALVVPHQPSITGVRALRACGYPDERVVVNLDRYGNCVASSIPLGLYDAVRQGRVQRGDELLLLGTSAGLSFGGVIFVY